MVEATAAMFNRVGAASPAALELEAARYKRTIVSTNSIQLFRGHERMQPRQSFEASRVEVSCRDGGFGKDRSLEAPEPRMVPYLGNVDGAISQAIEGAR